MTEDDFWKAANRFKLNWPLKMFSTRWELLPDKMLRQHFVSTYGVDAANKPTGPGWLINRDGPMVISRSSVQTGDTVNLDLETDLYPFYFENFRDDEDVWSFLRECVKYRLCHEVDEAITVDGHRIYDPHVFPSDTSLACLRKWLYHPQCGRP